jgi:hypothetical protein
MKGKFLVGSIAGAACLFAATAALAEPFDVKLQAPIFNTRLVQAMDECASPTTVISGLPACAPTNVATAPASTFSVGRLVVKSRNVPSQVLAVVRSSPNAAFKKGLAGRNLRVRLTLRISKRSSTGAPTPATTWVDQVYTCSATPPVPSNGNWVFKKALVGLSGCGVPGILANEGFQKEIVSAAVIDGDTGQPIAVPGVRQR